MSEHPAKRSTTGFVTRSVIPQKRSSLGESGQGRAHQENKDDDTIIINLDEYGNDTGKTSLNPIPKKGRGRPKKTEIVSPRPETSVAALPTGSLNPHSDRTRTPRSDRTIDIPIRSPVSLKGRLFSNERASSSAADAATASACSRYGHKGRIVTGHSTLNFFPNTNMRSTGKLASKSTNATEEPREPVLSKRAAEKMDEIADSDDEDIESLASLSDLLGGDKKTKSNVIESLRGAEQRQRDEDEDEDEKEEAERLRLLSMFNPRGGSAFAKGKMTDLKQRQKASQVSFSQLLNDDDTDKHTRMAIADAKARLDAVTQELEVADQKDLDKQRLAAILKGSSTDLEVGEFERLMCAVDRTEAFSTHRTLCFFSSYGADYSNRECSVKEPPEFPKSCIPGSLWAAHDMQARDKMILSGLLRDLVLIGKLDEQVIRWVFDAMLIEKRGELRQAYIELIGAASPNWTRVALHAEDIKSLFIHLGACSEAVNPSTNIERQRISPINTGTIGDFDDLRSVLDLLLLVCDHLDFECLTVLSSIVVRLMLDELVMLHCQVPIIQLMSRLLAIPDPTSQAHVHDRLVCDLTTNLKDVTLQVQLLSKIPLSTPRERNLCRCLANAFLFGSNAGNEVSLPTILNHLEGHALFTNVRPKSSLGSSESYVQLAAQTKILNICIADGSPPVLDSRASEQSFNDDVDALAGHIHQLFTDIADSGAGHMRRTEAKAALQALELRLLHGVRTKPRRRRHVFDSDHLLSPHRKGVVRTRDAAEIETTVKSRDIMARFLKQGL